MTDAEYARFKRAADFYSVDPDFRQRALEDPAGALKGLGLSIGDPALALRGITAVTGGRAANDAANPYTAEYLRRYRAVSDFVAQSHRREAFSRDAFFRFADTTRNRCRMVSRLIRCHDNIRYFPLCFELSLGCSVQCPFCGLDASRWQRDFRYTPENAALWQAVLHSSVELLGPIAGAAPCYLATEPLDNPDYERFLGDFFRVTGQLPQTTTAIAERDTERTRNLMRLIGKDRLRLQAALRFSIRTKAQFYRIVEAFSPEELADVEILPNNPESLSLYAASGRARSGKGGKPSGPAYSICCIAGVRVNMAERRMQFMEPELPDSDFPLGVRVRETLYFDDAADYRRKLAHLMNAWAVGFLPPDRVLKLNRNCKAVPTEDAIAFLGDGVGYRITGNAYTFQMLELLEEGRSLEQIRREIRLPSARQESFYDLMNQLFIRGYLRLEA